MTLQEARKRLGLSRDILEKYVSLGIIRKGSMPDNYREEDFDRLGLVDILRGAGFTSEEIKIYFQFEETTNADEQQISMLKRQRRLLLDDIHKKQRILDSLDYMILEKRNVIET
ncbi:MerR family transcriptional regulator [Eubacterium callanderi]|uniref:MerR family transcriptional regulator n=1 Tax=Eubacterium callanderi TaxID=53442 RepID=A0A853JLB8_9FIRM|nr:MerR family transcriptional regulator [Eubacterium callanderi]